MALVRVRWTVTEEHVGEIEIDGFDETDPDADLTDAVIAEHEGNDTHRATIDREVLEFTVLRASDQVLSAEAAKIKAPQHDDDWGDE